MSTARDAAECRSHCVLSLLLGAQQVVTGDTDSGRTHHLQSWTECPKRPLPCSHGSSVYAQLRGRLDSHCQQEKASPSSPPPSRRWREFAQHEFSDIQQESVLIRERSLIHIRDHQDIQELNAVEMVEEFVSNSSRSHRRQRLSTRGLTSLGQNLRTPRSIRRPSLKSVRGPLRRVVYQAEQVRREAIRRFMVSGTEPCSPTSAVSHGCQTLYLEEVRIMRIAYGSPSGSELGWSCAPCTADICEQRAQSSRAPDGSPASWANRGRIWQCPGAGAPARLCSLFRNRNITYSPPWSQTATQTLF